MFHSFYVTAEFLLLIAVVEPK